MGVWGQSPQEWYPREARSPAVGFLAPPGPYPETAETDHGACQPSPATRARSSVPGSFPDRTAPRSWGTSEQVQIITKSCF
jgi:hypothetical protein